MVAAASAFAALGAAAGTASAHTAPHISKAECAANKAAGTVTYVSPFGFDASAGIIDIFAAQKLGYFADMCIKVQIIPLSYIGNLLVSSGAAQITNEGSAADTLLAIGSGSHFVGIETSGDTSDYAIITQKSITNLKQLAGKKLGYHPPVLPPILHEMLNKAGVNLGSVEQINDQNYDPNQIETGSVNGVEAYQSNEPLTLKAKNAPFNEFTPQQFHLQGTYNVMVANDKFLAQHRQTVADFMRADLHALDYCLTHQHTCVNIEGGYSSQAGAPFVTSHEDAVWALESQFTIHHTLAGKGIGVETTSEWTPEAKLLKKYSVLKPKPVPSLATAEDTTLIASLYHGKNLIWP
jgi:NitT/TauT family transport system substrate-binding protein